MPFRHDFACMVNPFIVSLDMTKMINILEEIIKTLHEKILKAVHLY